MSEKLTKKEILLRGKIEYPEEKTFPKVFLETKKIQWNNKFFQMNLWLPKPNPTMKEPMIALTFQIGGKEKKSFKIYAADIQELEGLILAMNDFFYIHKKELDEKLQAAKKEHRLIIQALHNAANS